MVAQFRRFLGLDPAALEASAGETLICEVVVERRLHSVVIVWIGAPDDPP